MNSSTTSATVVDVARLAGVSVGTVSRVLNGYSNVSAANLERVQKAMLDLGYEKCRSAEQLVSRRGGVRIQTGNIGVIFSEMGSSWADHPLVAAYSMGVEQACQKKGFHALIEFSEKGDALPRCVRENKVDALLIKGTRGLPAYLEELPKGLPTVCVGLNDPTANIQQVAPDNRGAGWVAADYLWGIGHRRIGFVCPELRHPMFLARFHGYEAFLRSRQGFDPALCAVDDSHESTGVPEFRPPDMSAAVEKLLAAPGEPVTAIIAANDWMAHGVYAALATAGKSIPEDVSVMAFDNAMAVCTSLRPQLTSYAIPFGEVAYAAAMKVIEKIQNPDVLWNHSLHLVRGSLVERESVKPLNLLAEDMT